MIEQTLCTSFKKEILLGVHDLTTDALRIALYTSLATINKDTTVYTTAGEVVGGNGYTQSGIWLTNAVVSSDGYTAYVSFDNPVWTAATFTARGALIYNATKSAKAIAVIDFGADKTANGTFTVQLPANTATSAIIRISN